VLVLLVNDLRDMRTTHKTMLETLGHQVIEAADGKGAIQVAATSRPDTIFIDLGIADIDGFLTVAALRTISPLRSVPIVAISDSPDHRERAAAAGCDAYLEKPITVERIADVLRTL
jgi:two-component system KDP operon response regulator KdpE